MDGDETKALRIDHLPVIDGSVKELATFVTMARREILAGHGVGAHCWLGRGLKGSADLQLPKGKSQKKSIP